MNRPRVLFITRKWPPAVGGMETYCFELAGELEALTDLTVLALPGRADGGVPGIFALAGFGLRTGWRLLTGAAGFDVVHGGDMAIWPLVLLARLRSGGALAVLSAHGSDVAYAERRGLAGRLYRLYMCLGATWMRRARIVANSEATAGRAQALGFAAVDVVPLATRVQTSAPATAPASDERYLLFAGRLSRRKGLAWFAANVLPGLAEAITLRVAGPSWDDDERAALDNPRVRYVGPLAPRELASAMRQAVCVVVPNIAVGDGHFEGFGLVAVEAAAVGGVVVAARLDGLCSAVIDGETGFLVEPGDTAAWIARLTEIAAWPEERRRAFVATSERRSREVFAWPRVARQTLRAYGVDPISTTDPAPTVDPVPTNDPGR